MDPYDYDQLFEIYFGNIQVQRQTHRVNRRDFADEWLRKDNPVECNNLLSIITASKILVD